MKTSLAKLYVKATLCENREEGSFEPCNTCDSCVKLNDNNRQHPNVTEYRVTEASTFKEVVGDLIETTKASPVITDDNLRDDQLRRFIVIDEVQNASRASIGPFLDSLEFSHSKVTIVLISMDLSKMDPIVKDAIESRCIELNLGSLSNEKISNNITSKYPNIAEGVAELIAFLSKGNMRKAWSILEFFLTQLSIEELTTDIIYDQKFGGLSDVMIDTLIDKLENSTWENTKSIINKFAAAEIMAVDLLMRSLVNKELTEDGISLVSDLSIWYQCTYKAPLLTVFLPFQGRLLIEKDDMLEIADRPIKSVKAVNSTPEKLKNMTKDLSEQLSSMSGKKVDIEERDLSFLTFNTWREYMDYYAENN